MWILMYAVEVFYHLTTLSALESCAIQSADLFS